MRILTAVAAGSVMSAALALAGGAQAATSAGNHDLQCFIAASQIALSNDQDTKSQGLIASMFFAGKIFGANPSIDLKAALATETDRMAKLDMQALLKECGAEMKSRGDQIQVAGQALEAAGK